MDFRKVNLAHPSGVIVSRPVGFSWTTFFFRFFVPLLRGDVPWATLMVLLNISAYITSMSMVFGKYQDMAVAVGLTTISLLQSIITGSIYNKYHLRALLTKGYKPVTEQDKEILLQYRYISDRALQSSS